MTAIKYEAELLRTEKLTDGIYRITLLAPDIAKLASPGQFIMVKADNNLSTPLLRRPFSIHQVSADGHLQILFKVVGNGTAFLSNRKPGEVLSLVGPLGRGFSYPENPANICLVGGGVGVAPLYYLAQKLMLEHNDKINDVQVFLGAATASEIVFIQNEFINLGFNKVFVATDDGSSGHHGFVTELLAAELEQDRTWHLYCCGPHPMMKVVANYCRKMAWPCQVSLETIMACGVAACLGCAIRGSKKGLNVGQYLHVCKEGPVFEAGEVGW